MSESNDKNKQFPHIPFYGSGSLHATEEGKVWIRLLINLCWWLHDMYQVDSTNPDAKVQYIEQQISQCHTLFPAQFTLMFSDPKFSSNDQHPLLICRQEEHKIIIVVFRATVSSKSIQDVFTDICIYSDHRVYLGSRHAGFAQRLETGPLLAVTNWLRRGWKVIITGHSLGGAVSQLFTTEIINKLVESGLSPEMASLRCVTFGTPQCADHHFWSSYTAWYDTFDSYVYGNDAIFRLATFGAEKTKEVIDSFIKCLQQAGLKLYTNMISYKNEDQPPILVQAIYQFSDICNDALIPAYSTFGRHHFIRKDERSQFKIDSIGEQEDEKNRLLEGLSVGHCWYHYFIERKLIPDQFKFIYREFMEHGCYPFVINQLFNREINLSYDKQHSIKPKLFRIGANNKRHIGNQPSDISAFINFPDKNSVCYIYFEGFLTDFITSVTLPIELAGFEQLRETKPTLSPDQPDVCTILCFKSDESIKYLQANRDFEVKVTTHFGCINVQVAVLSNSESTLSSVYQLDPIQIVLRAYNEFILNATSIEHINSPLSFYFSLFFSAFKRIGQNEFDMIIARYLTEAEARNLIPDIEKHIESCHLPETKDEATTYFNDCLKSLSNDINDDKSEPEMKHNATFLFNALKREASGSYPIAPCSLQTKDVNFDKQSELIPLYLDFVQLCQCLRQLHTVYDLSSVERNIKVMRAPYIFIIIKLQRLYSVKQYTTMEKMFQGIKMLWRNKFVIAAGAASVGPIGATGAALWSISKRQQFFGDHEKVIKSLIGVATTILASIDCVDVTDKNEDPWEILNQIYSCHALRCLIQVKSTGDCDVAWSKIFTKGPMKSVSPGDRWYFISVTDICYEVVAMRQILASLPPKLVIIGQSQTGKTTLFHHLTKCYPKELDDVTRFNTRMSLQCRAFIELDRKSNNDKVTDRSGLPIDVIDNPGYDDATGQSKILLSLLLKAANLVILMTTLRDINQEGTIKQLLGILDNTKANILVLINQVDNRLKAELEKYRRRDSDIRENSDDDESEDEGDQRFSVCQLLDTLLERPEKELIQKLRVDPFTLEQRVTFQPVILKGFNEFNKTFDEPAFRDKVHKSNVNKWIKKNLLNNIG